MAAIHDGRVTVVLTAKISWWISPYLWAAKMAVWSVAPFVDIDDEQIAAFAQKQATFIAAHGIRFYAGGRRI